MTTHSSTLAWKIPWMEEPNGLQSMGSLSRTRLKRVSSNSSSQYSCLGNPMEIPWIEEPGGLPWGCKSWT